MAITEPYMAVSDQPRVLKPWLRLLLIIIGTVLTGLGILGIFLPVLPTTPFMLLAAICYGRSSQRLYTWLLYNRWFGKYIRNYIQKKGIPLRVKVITIAILWVTIGTSAVFAVDSLILRVILAVIAIVVTIHLLLVPTFKK